MAPRAKLMVEQDRFHYVTGAPVLDQPVYAAMYERNRTLRSYKQMVKTVQKRLQA